MKVRNGFVSNSSSSSYICDVSGSIESGWDMCLSDAGMLSCENGHTFLENYVVEYDKKEVYLRRMEEALEYSIKYDRDDVEEIKEVINEIKNNPDYDDYESLNDDYELEMDYEFPAEGCPICTMKHIMEDDMASYLLKKNGVSREDIQKEIKEKFNNYTELQKYIKENE